MRFPQYFTSYWTRTNFKSFTILSLLFSKATRSAFSLFVLENEGCTLNVRFTHALQCLMDVCLALVYFSLPLVALYWLLFLSLFSKTLIAAIRTNVWYGMIQWNNGSDNQNWTVMSSNIRTLKICRFCRNELVAVKITSRTCSEDCARRFYKLRQRDSRKWFHSFWHISRPLGGISNVFIWGEVSGN